MQKINNPSVMKIKEVVCYKCFRCEALHLEELEASHCCGKPEKTIGFSSGNYIYYNVDPILANLKKDKNKKYDVIEIERLKDNKG